MWLLIHKSGKTYLAPDRATYNTEYGLVELKRGYTKSSTGEEFLVTRPGFVDLWMRIKRGPQIAHWKDLGLIAALTGIGPGSRVLEVGAGSGFSTLFWAHLVGERGRVLSYEKNPKHYALLVENIEKFGFSHLEVLPDDPRKVGVKEKDFDLAFLDVPDPWELVHIVGDSLRPGAFLVSYLPTVEQVKRLEESLDGFTEPAVHEVIHREWKLGGRTRPLSSGILHTAFIVVARKIR